MQIKIKIKIKINGNKYASNNLIHFDNIINKFNKNIISYSKEECLKMYQEYKHLCIFTKLIHMSYLFENKNKVLNTINKAIGFIIESNDFTKLYKTHIRDIYKNLFDKEYSKLSLIEKIENMNKDIKRLYDCINGRIGHHLNCVKYTVKYNIDSHKHEILFSIYMFNKIKEIQKLLNDFKHKHGLIKDKLIKEANIKQKEADIKQKEANLAYVKSEMFDNLSIDSSTVISEPFLNINKSKRTKRK